MNPFEQIHRLTKTARMVAQIDASIDFWNLHPYRHADQIVIFLSNFDERKWLTVAAAAGVLDPSDKTIAAVIEVYQTRARSKLLGARRRQDGSRAAKKAPAVSWSGRRTLTGRDRKGT